MKPRSLLLALFLVPLTLRSADFQITAERDHTETVKAKAVADGETTGGKEKLVYNIKVSNTSFKPTNALKAEYIIFIERQELGKKAGTETIERVKGSGDIKPLVPRADDAFKTSEVSLREQSLTGYTIFVKGGRVKAKDSVKGVWIRLMDGTTVVAEYVNPTTIKSKEKW